MTDTATPTRTIAVIDGNSLMHRAFHAIMQPMSAPDGRATNALFGFFNMFIKLVESFEPDGVICAFDKGKPTARMEMLSQYKAQRPPMDPHLREQFPMVKELLASLDVPVVELEGWEGDDILGTVATMGAAQGYEMLLFTGDRDMYQLVSDNIKVISTKKGVSDVAVMTPESVDDLYHGVTPALVPDFYGLKGDTSDNIPGVPGIGPKRAADLICQYGSLDEVLAHAGEIKGKMGENLRAHMDDALVSREVARIRCDAPIELDLDDARFPTFDPNKVVEAFSALGFTGMTRRLVRLGGEDVSIASAVVEALEVKLLDEASLEAALTCALEAGAWVGVAIEEVAEKKGQLSLEALMAPERAVWVALPEGVGRMVGPAMEDALVGLFTRGRVASADVKALLHEVYPADSALPTLIDAADVGAERIFDVGVAAYLLDSDRSAYDVEGLAQRYLAQALPEPSEALPLAAIRAAALPKLKEALEKKLGEDGSLELFAQVEMPLLLVLAAMERVGLAVDTDVLAAQSAELGLEIDAMAQRIYEEAGVEFNIDSPMQLSHVLFDEDKLHLPTNGLRRTQRGYYSTNAKVLEDLARTSTVVADVLDYRERAKIRNTYLDALPALVADDGRIHTTFNQTVAATGRLSSSDPNLQNIPTRSELGHRVRQAFAVAPGNVFLAVDYSQIELRLLAHLSGDENLIAAFNEGADFHAATAARTFGVSVDEVTPELRSRAKAVNFGIVYGQQAFGLAQSLKISRAEAQDMIDRYYSAYPGVRSYLDECVRLAHERGWAVTMYGRKRHIKEFAPGANRNLVAYGERTAMNHPMQGTAADIIKIAMVRVARRLREEGFAAKLVLQIHDELDFEVAEAEREALTQLVVETMEGVAELRVPLIADASFGATWAEAK